MSLWDTINHEEAAPVPIREGRFFLFPSMREGGVGVITL